MEYSFSFASVAVVVVVGPPLNHHLVYGDSQRRIGCSSFLFDEGCILFTNWYLEIRV